MFDTKCNSTLADLRITSELPVAGSLTFHQLGLILTAACTLIAVIVSFYLIWMHAIHYTKPYEQRHIIRILFMIPVYAVASLLSFIYYWHSIYFTVISDCYEAFAIASFFALLCHYTAPALHEQKNYFRYMSEIKGWVWPLNWWVCCGGRKTGPFRTPRSGLTWFNIIWVGIYQYCFIRVAMTIVAVVTQYFGRYCESSNSPAFAHIWVLVIESIAVTIAMYMLIQFYVQLRHDLAEHRPFLKVLAIKLVIFLSFWQSFCISLAIGPTFNLVRANDYLAYPDIAEGIPALLVCIEMALFSILHLWAFPYSPYKDAAKVSRYPASGDAAHDPGFNVRGEKQGGPLGVKALIDAMNPWDLVKAFARSMRWMFVGVRHRENDPSYKIGGNDMVLDSAAVDTSYKARDSRAYPIANQFRQSRFGLSGETDDQAALITNAQPRPVMNLDGNQSASQLSTPRPGQYTPARLRYDAATGQELSTGGTKYEQVGASDFNHTSSPISPVDIGMATSTYGDSYPHQPVAAETNAAHSMLWGSPALTGPPAQQRNNQF